MGNYILDYHSVENKGNIVLRKYLTPLRELCTIKSMKAQQSKTREEIQRRLAELREILKSEMARYKWQEAPEKVHRLQGNIGALEWVLRDEGGAS